MTEVIERGKSRAQDRKDVDDFLRTHHYDCRRDGYLDNVPLINRDELRRDYEKYGV